MAASLISGRRAEIRESLGQGLPPVPSRQDPRVMSRMDRLRETQCPIGRITPFISSPLSRPLDSIRLFLFKLWLAIPWTMNLVVVSSSSPSAESMKLGGADSYLSPRPSSNHH